MGVRLFVSIDLVSDLHDGVAEAQEPFAGIPGVRLTDPAQTHVTLKFLGEVPGERVPAVRGALETAVSGARVSPFHARFGGLGVFPEFDYISVIWIGVPTGGSEMAALHESIEREMVDLGFDEERHTFTPHATIARMDHGKGKEEVQRILRSRTPLSAR